MSKRDVMVKAWEGNNPVSGLPNWLILAGAGIVIFRLVTGRFIWEKALIERKAEAIAEAERIVKKE